MARYPGLIWDPSPNFRAGPTRKRRVVLHRMAGSYAGGLSWLKNRASQVSANFVVNNLSGEGRQLVDTADIAWAQAAFNDDSISIEISGQGGDPVTEEAWATITFIVATAHRLDGVPLVLATPEETFVGLANHGQLGPAGGGHPLCPGPVVLDHLAATLAAALILEDPMIDAAFTDTTDARRTQIREWYAAYLGKGPGGRDPESEAVIEGWLAAWTAHGGESVRTAIYDSDEAKQRRARETAALGPVAAPGGS